MICLVRVELSCTLVPPNPVPGVVDIFYVAQLIFPSEYVTSVSIGGFVPPGGSLDFLWEIVFQSSDEVGVLSLFTYWKL